MRSDLHDDPAVFRLASMLKIDKFAVIGRLHTFWSWVDRHSVDGFVDGATSTAVDEVVRCEGFAESLAKVKWLEITDDGIRIPKFDRHNGDSAKQRALKNERQARWRAQKDAVVGGDVDAHVDGGASTTASTREEKRREDKETKARAPRFDAQAHLESMGVDPNVARDWLTLRAGKKLKPTETAFAGVLKEAQKAGLSMNDALLLCCTRGWGGFEASWAAAQSGGKSQTQQFGGEKYL